MKRTATLLLLFLAGLAPAAVVECRWRADVTAPAAAQFPVGRGETVSFACDLVDRSGAPVSLPDGTEAAMYWQTNGMGDVWYSGPATVSNATLRATWIPEYDPGAPLVRLFLSAEAPDGAVAHRAFANLRFYATPGTDPEVVPVPERVIDLAPVAVITNSPWARAVAGLAGARAATDATNAVSDLLAEAVGTAPADATLEVHRLLISDLWRRVDGIPGIDVPDELDDLREEDAALAGRIDELERRAQDAEARIAALEAAASRATTPVLRAVPESVATTDGDAGTTAEAEER